ncbi:hypothetical protein [Lactobacillus taiwanensis]|uniref:hypothetical protein n=1 Tax=Lactobacillus taiwanensis TaxID=508451 RepID=UPI003220946A
MKELLKFPHEEFTVKRDFNMTGFLLTLKPDEAFEVSNAASDIFERTNTSSNIRLNNNARLEKDHVIRLIEAKRKTVIYYSGSKKMLCFNFGDSFEDRLTLAKKVGAY